MYFHLECIKISIISIHLISILLSKFTSFGHLDSQILTVIVTQRIRGSRHPFLYFTA